MGVCTALRVSPYAGGIRPQYAQRLPLEAQTYRFATAAPPPRPQVRFQEAVDAMVGQLLRRLWEAEAAGRGRYVVAVTGDHSTPVVFGDHSHEPVPFAIATVKHAVEVCAWGCADSRRV